MAYGKINTLIVYRSNDAEIFKVGQKVGESSELREIAEIKDNGLQFEDITCTMYDLIDKNGDIIARFENGIYATWFDRPEVK